MIVKLSVISSKSKIIIKPTITKFEDEGALSAFIVSKNYKLEDVVEILSGGNFSSLTSIDKDCLDEINLSDIKEQGKTLHIKIIMK